MSWNHVSKDGIATNKDEVSGGIVDFNCDGWFTIPNNDDIEMKEGFATKQEAIDYIEKEASLWKEAKNNIELMVISKLKAEQCESIDHNELWRCVKGCVLPNSMMRHINKMIKDGSLNMESIR